MKVLARTSFTVSRRECCFDRACDAAYQLALGKFGVGEDGYIANVVGGGEGCSMVVEFVKYVRSGSMAGHSHEYTFEARVEEYDDDAG